jgi:hypothetical protein
MHGTARRSAALHRVRLGAKPDYVASARSTVKKRQLLFCIDAECVQHIHKKVQVAVCLIKRHQQGVGPHEEKAL